MCHDKIEFLMNRYLMLIRNRLVRAPNVSYSLFQTLIGEEFTNDLRFKKQKPSQYKEKKQLLERSKNMSNGGLAKSKLMEHKLLDK